MNSFFPLKVIRFSYLKIHILNYDGDMVNKRRTEFIFFSTLITLIKYLCKSKQIWTWEIEYIAQNGFII